MIGKIIKIAKDALKIMIQSIQKNSYFQIIGLGNNFKKFSEKPLSYSKRNIEYTLNKIKADLGETNVYKSLNEIYNLKFNKEYEKKPKNIILLTDVEINNKGKELKLIEENNTKYYQFSVGIGNNFNESLIKSSGL